MADGLQNRVAAEVRAEMARQRLTQKDLAKVLGISAAQVGRRLQGRIAFDINEIEKIAQALEVAPARLLERAA